MASFVERYLTRTQRLNIVMRVATLMRVPVTPHQRFFGAKRLTKGSNVKRSSSSNEPNAAPSLP